MIVFILSQCQISNVKFYTHKNYLLNKTSFSLFISKESTSHNRIVPFSLLKIFILRTTSCYKNEIIKFQCNLFLWCSHSTSSIVFFSIFLKNKIPVLNIPIPPYSLLFVWKWNSNILSFRFHPFTPCMLVICDPFCISSCDPFCIFSSPELKAQVSFSDHLSSVAGCPSFCLFVCLSVCQLFLFSTSSQKPLG